MLSQSFSSSNTLNTALLYFQRASTRPSKTRENWKLSKTQFTWIMRNGEKFRISVLRNWCQILNLSLSYLIYDFYKITLDFIYYQLWKSKYGETKNYENKLIINSFVYFLGKFYDTSLEGKEVLNNTILNRFIIIINIL